MLRGIVKLTVIILSPILGLLFGCGGDTVNVFYAATMAYMAPVYDLKITGKVMDSVTTNAIQNIRVSLLQGTTTNTATNTAADGTYSIELTNAFGSYTLRAEDVDGAANGVYQAQTNLIQLSGDLTTNVDIKLN